MAASVALHATPSAPRPAAWSIATVRFAAKIHGALSVAYAMVERKHPTIDKGADVLTAYDSSHRVRREFCRHCGGSLFFEVENAPKVTYIAAATLDGGLHPGHPLGSERHAEVGSKAKWERISDNLPRFETVELETADGGGNEFEDDIPRQPITERFSRD